MKKQAFTLTEILITLGIIGVLAAIVTPSITKIHPDETKVKYMKAYNALATLAPEIANDESLFLKEEVLNNTTGNVELSTAGILNWNEPSATMREIIDPIYFKEGLFTKDKGVLGNSNAHGPAGPNKFGYFFSRRLNLASGYKCLNSDSEFTTGEGIDWLIKGAGSEGTYTTNYAGSANPSVATNYRQIVRIDVDGSGGKNCIYNKSSCTKPDRFIFYVYTYGNVEAADPLGKAFLLNPTDMHSMEKDLEKAKTL